LKIEAPQWAQYSELKKRDKDTPAFDLFIRNQIEERVNKLPHVLKGHHGDKIEIASVNIAYKNREIIKLLQERGSIVTAAKFDKLEEIDEKIH